MKFALASAIFFFVLLFVPAPTHAATATFFGPIVAPECHCENQADPTNSSNKITTAAGYGCVLQTLQNSINLLISLSIIICILWLAFAGLQFMMSSASPGLREQGRTRITNGIIGIVVILAAWLTVDFVMKTLYDSNGQFGPWNAILVGKSDGSDKCIVAVKPTTLATGTLGIVSGPPGTTASNPATGAAANTASGNESAVRSQLSTAGININKGSCPANMRFQDVNGGCTSVGGLQQNTINQIIAIKNVCGSVQVTGGNELGHSDGGQSHTTGYKVDLATNIDSCIYNGSNGYFSRNGSRGSDAQYKDKCGNNYVRESSPAHWDITVTSTCSP